MSCKYIHIVNSITTGTGTVTLNFSNPVTSATDKEKFCIKIPCGVTIPSGVSASVVNIAFDGGTIPLWNKYGNPATVSDLKKNCVMSGFYGATTSHVISKIPMTYNCGCNNVL